MKTATRSFAVPRRIVHVWLRVRREREITDAYARAYGDGGLGDEWAGWEAQCQWLEA